jgi:hypothetical protein
MSRVPAVSDASRGFTPFVREDYKQWKKEGRLVNAGVHAQVGRGAGGGGGQVVKGKGNQGTVVVGCFLINGCIGCSAG